tara:strand:+ start:39 stop:311 length:273 start_codon:yes stop_codon:yes gene_type:complete
MDSMSFRKAVDMRRGLTPWYVAISSEETRAVAGYAILHGMDPEVYTEGQLATLEEAAYHALSCRRVRIVSRAKLEAYSEGAFELLPEVEP